MKGIDTLVSAGGGGGAPEFIAVGLYLLRKVGVAVFFFSMIADFLFRAALR